MEKLIPSVLALFVYESVWFLICMNKKNFGLIDIAWGPGFVLLISFPFFSSEFSFKSVLILMSVIFWATRLTIHLGKRNWSAREDFRYQEMRKNWRRWPLLQAYLKVNILQGVLTFIFGAAIFRGVEIGGNFIWINWVGFFIFCLGLFWESWADWELQKYKKLKATSFCISGPWKYSRHPNYFGEISLWWGLWLMSLPEGAWAFFSPLLLHLFIVKISGVPLMAKHLERRDGYKQYAERINLLFPMPPKNV